MATASLVLIYNHQYNDNIARLEYLYGDRFRRIFHLVPFYTGSRSNVIPVYENSHFFQGYVAQAWSTLNQVGCDHYLFIADDLLLNPNINESNYIEYFNLTLQESFLPGFAQFHNCKFFWHRCRDAVLFNISQAGLEIMNILPSQDTVLRRFSTHGLRPQPIPTPLLIPDLPDDDPRFDQAVELPYPLVGGYSDIFVIGKETMPMFSHLCGVFAACRLFVEVAIPTSLAIASSSVSTESKTKLKGKTLWSPDDYEYLSKYDSSLSSLMSAFPSDTLYIHPIKLSSWWKIK